MSEESFFTAAFPEIEDKGTIGPLRLFLGAAIATALLRIIYHMIRHSARVDIIISPIIAAIFPETVGFCRRGFPVTPWLISGHLQTIYAARISNKDYPEVRYARETIRAKDGGVFTLDWGMPHSDQDFPQGTPTIVILHGLSGGSQEAYVKSLISEISKTTSFRCVVFNARGCAGSHLETPQFYCASYTNDVRYAVRRIQEVVGDAPLAAIGYSLGSNILVKYLGEEGIRTPFIAAVSVGNPFDLMCAMRSMDGSFLYRKTYSSALASNLVRAFKRHQAKFEGHPDLNIQELLASKTVYEFDERFTRRMFGYESVSHYYRDGSSDLYIPKVAIPLLCLQAEDDPISVYDGIPFDGIASNPLVSLVLTKRGGHIAWFSGFWSPEPWSNGVFVRFFEESFRAHKSGVLERQVKKLREEHLRKIEKITSIRRKFFADSIVKTDDSAPSTSPSESFQIEELRSKSFLVLNGEPESSPSHWFTERDLSPSEIQNPITSVPITPVPVAPIPIPLKTAPAATHESHSKNLKLIRLLKENPKSSAYLGVISLVLGVAVGYYMGNRRRM